MSTDNSTVTYKDIPGFPGYRAGDDGSVWSRWVVGGVPGKRGISIRIEGEWRLKSHRAASNGYRVVTLRPNKKTHSVARLILLAFVGPCPDGMECCHGDGDRTNNKLQNLRWGTHVENEADRQKHGRVPRGESSGLSKLTEEDVRAIRQRRLAGDSGAKLARAYAVSQATVSLIVRRKLWRHVQ